MLGRRAFPAGAVVADFGTGGGLPGIPLAIRFPDVHFILIDSIGKKTDLVLAIVATLGLPNVEVVQSRAESWDGECDFAVSRATAPLRTLWSWTAPRLADRPAFSVGAETEDLWMPGLLALKGGDLSDEIREMEADYPDLAVVEIPLDEFCEGFPDKSVVHVCGGTRAESKV